MLYFGIFLAVYLLLSFITYWVMKPSVEQWSGILRPGSKFVSNQEGVEQTILGMVGNLVEVSCRVRPHAPGPPEHLHQTFDETFAVKEGVLSLKVEDQIMRLSAGQRFTVKRGQYHKFWNETDQAVVIEDTTHELSLPLAFALTLAQFYGITNEQPEVASPPKVLLQLSAFGGDFDSFIKDGPPPAALKVLYFLLSPVAKLAGYEYANPKYFPKK